MISVIVPTYNGAIKLPGIMEALLKQTFVSFELIVAIDGSTDNSVDIIASYQPKFENLKIISQPNKGRAAIRNAGAKAATGDVVIFFDDDLRPAPDCVKQHVEHHSVFPGSLMSGAQIDDYAVAKNDFQKYKCCLSRKWSIPLIAWGNKPLTINNLHLTAANFSVSKKVFQLLGGFDEKLRDAEDFDLAIRALQADISVYYNHKAFSWHDDFVTPSSYIRRLREYQKAHETLRRLKPKIYRDIKLRAPQNPTGIRKFIFSFFGRSYWIPFISSNAILLLPKKIRYKLYDLVTTSLGVFHPNKAL